jgi:hypothetical protein
VGFAFLKDLGISIVVWEMLSKINRTSRRKLNVLTLTALQIVICQRTLFKKGSIMLLHVQIASWDAYIVWGSRILLTEYRLNLHRRSYTGTKPHEILHTSFRNWNHAPSGRINETRTEGWISKGAGSNHLKSDITLEWPPLHHKKTGCRFKK